jgi:hypothetical protein
MSNHYHLLVKVCPEPLEDFGEDDIMDRWSARFKGPLLIQNCRSGEDFRFKAFQHQLVYALPESAHGS